MCQSQHTERRLERFLSVIVGALLRDPQRRLEVRHRVVVVLHTELGIEIKMNIDINFDIIEIQLNIDIHFDI